MLYYTYTPSGQKISQQLEVDGKISTRRDYAGSFVYVNNELAWVNTPHGRMVNKTHGGKEMEEYVLEFHLRDHLGNTRATYQGGTLTSQTDYYPFGLTFYNGVSQGTSTLTQNRYLYNGKELQDDFGLDWYDYGWRFYDASIGRWHSVDPHAENYLPVSPYAYVGNNPIVRIDPDGRDWYEDKEGNLHWHAELTKDNYNDFFIDHNIEGSYLGEIGFSVDEEGLSILHNADGTETAGFWQLNEVVVEAEMTDHQRTMNNPLVQANHEGQSEFLRGAADVTAHSLSMTGDLMTYTGTGLMLFPGAQMVGGGLIATGNSFSTAGTVISMGLNANDGEWGQLITNGVTLGRSYGMRDGINRLKKWNEAQKDFLRGASDSGNSVFSRIISWGLNKED